MNGQLTSHVTREDLELFVICALDAHRAQGVEAHVAECEVCSQALAEEARLELAVIEVAAARPSPARAPVVAMPPRGVVETPRAPRPVVPRPRIGRVIVASIGTLSLAAAWMLWLGSNTSGHTSTEPAERTAARVMASDDAGSMASLDAHHDQLDGS